MFFRSHSHSFLLPTAQLPRMSSRPSLGRNFEAEELQIKREIGLNHGHGNLPGHIMYNQVKHARGSPMSLILRTSPSGMAETQTAVMHRRLKAALPTCSRWHSACNCTASEAIKLCVCVFVTKIRTMRPTWPGFKSLHQFGSTQVKTMVDGPNSPEYMLFFSSSMT